MSDVMTMSNPGEGLATPKMPGHWVLARLGKRVLRPGGMELTRRMLDALSVGAKDDAVEFAPGLGLTAQLTLKRNPASYTAVERDEAAAEIVRKVLKGSGQKCVTGSADQTGLPAEVATVVYGEAMLTMQTAEMKRRIVGEAHRLLKRGGRYAIHEMCLVEDDLDVEVRKEINQALSQAIHVGVRPLSVSEWRELMEAEGFEVQAEVRAPMHLLEPRRLLRDEGLRGTLRFIWNVMRDRDARARMLMMRSVFRRYQSHLAAVMLVSVKR
ncbi:MAG TPA: methyltransferase domain-containing protein [Pyrinomonadaceae bacterium]|nr:methyltransferase domain-containing protein [Pyrinomonadaceae bacterium]